MLVLLQSVVIGLIWVNSIIILLTIGVVTSHLRWRRQTWSSLFPPQMHVIWTYDKISWLWRIWLQGKYVRSSRATRLRLYRALTLVLNRRYIATSSSVQPCYVKYVNLHSLPRRPMYVKEPVSVLPPSQVENKCSQITTCHVRSVIRTLRRQMFNIPNTVS